jgi:hypothetical protein
VLSAFAFTDLFGVMGFSILVNTKASFDGTGYTNQLFLYHLAESYYNNIFYYEMTNPLRFVGFI